MREERAYEGYEQKLEFKITIHFASVNLGPKDQLQYPWGIYSVHWYFASSFSMLKRISPCKWMGQASQRLLDLVETWLALYENITGAWFTVLGYVLTFCYEVHMVWDLTWVFLGESYNHIVKHLSLELSLIYVAGSSCDLPLFKHASQVVVKTLK